MKTGKFYTGAVLMLGLTLAAPAVWACGGGQGGSELAQKFFYKAHMLMEHQEAVGLSADQVEAIRKLKMDFKKEWIRTSAEVDVLKLDIKSGLYADKPDVAAIQKLVDQKYELKKGLSKKLIESLVQLKAVPDAKQWEAFKKLKEEGGGKGFCPRCSGMKHGS